MVAGAGDVEGPAPLEVAESVPPPPSAHANAEKARGEIKEIKASRDRLHAKSKNHL